MNWWLLFQLTQWAGPLGNVPDYYQLIDSVFFARPQLHGHINPLKPDTLLLDAALFHATNEARRRADKPPLQYDPMLYSAARAHAESMIRNDFYNHDDLTNPLQKTVSKRVSMRTRRFVTVAENIGQYHTIDVGERYASRRNAKTGRFEYVELGTNRLYFPYTYQAYARYAVEQWVNSPHHRANLLNPAFTHLACAARLSGQPYQQRHASFARLVQNFGNATPPVSLSASPPQALANPR